MGNCCCPTDVQNSDEEDTALNQNRYNTNNGYNNRKTTSTKPFQGEGHRLGTVNDTTQNGNTGTDETNNNNDNPLPKPIIVDENLTEDEREKIRAERAAAAEARLKKMGGTTNNKKPKKPTTTTTELRGPNSKNTMAWTVG